MYILTEHSVHVEAANPRRAVDDDGCPSPLQARKLVTSMKLAMLGPIVGTIQQTASAVHLKRRMQHYNSQLSGERWVQRLWARRSSCARKLNHLRCTPRVLLTTTGRDSMSFDSPVSSECHAEAQNQEHVECVKTTAHKRPRARSLCQRVQWVSHRITSCKATIIVTHRRIYF